MSIGAAPLLQAGATYFAGDAAGAGAAAGGAGLAAAAPFVAIPAAIAAAIAYGTSPTVRKFVNSGAHSLWEGISNPFQHFGDGSSKDTLPISQLLHAGASLTGGPMGGMDGMMDNSGGFLKSLMGQNGQMDQSRRQNQQGGPGAGMNPYDQGYRGPNPIAPLNLPAQMPNPNVLFQDPYAQQMRKGFNY